MSAEQPEGFDPVRSDEERRFEAAKVRAQNLQGFYIHLIVFVVVNAGLFAINALSRGDGSWWFYWPLGAWAIALAIHATTLLGLFSPEWAERRARESLRRTGHA